MSDWFTVERIEADTFAVSEYRHWEETHCYLLCGSEAALLIDAGLGVGRLRELVDELTSLPVTVALTHAHWDHMGGLASFERFCLHEAEVPWVRGAFPLTPEEVRKSLLLLPCAFPPEFAPDRYRVFQGEPFRVLRDRDLFDLGNRRITALHTPGHSPGHCCFWEEDRRSLYTGDLIYRGCLDAFYPSTDPEQYYRSVEEISALPAERLLPGHHSLELPPTLLQSVRQGFEALAEVGRLRHGEGTFSFGEFQIRL